MITTKHKIAVVIPCYHVKAHIKNVVKAIPDFVWKIYCVDDACPDKSGDFIDNTIEDKRLHLLKHDTNQGVGGAMITGYKKAIEDGAEIVVKIDGDGQMDPDLIKDFVMPILSGSCDYTKGNRFYNIEDVKAMPTIRLFGNAILSFMTKLSSGYWDIFDPTNGYTAISAEALKTLPLDKIERRYFFESDMLFRLNTIRKVVYDIPMKATYGDEKSSLKISKIVWPFMIKHIRNFFKRIFYNYFLRDFSIASIELVLGSILLLFGTFFGVSNWLESISLKTTASAGTVMISALPIIIGIQLLLSFLQYDINSVPKTKILKKL